MEVFALLFIFHLPITRDRQLTVHEFDFEVRFIYSGYSYLDFIGFFILCDIHCRTELLQIGTERII